MQFRNLYIICTVHLELRLNSSLTVSIVSALQVSVENELELILQTLSTLKDYIWKKEWEKTAMAQEIFELKKQVALMEDRLIENQKQLHEKVDWYSNQLMKYDKQKEALEGEVSVLKCENEALKNDAIKQDKELSTAVATLKLRDEQYAAMDQVLVGLKDELNQLHTTISALKADLQDECEVLKKQIAKDSEKLEERSHQISDLSTTLSKEKEEKALVDTELKKAEASICTLYIELERCRAEKTIVEQDRTRITQEAQSTLNAEVVKWQKELVLMEERLKNKHNEVANIFEEKAVLETNLKRDLEVQTRKSNELEEENAAKEAEMTKKEEENAELKHKVDELLKDKELTKEKLVNEVVALQKQLEQIGTEKDHIMYLLAGVERNLLSVTNRKNELEAEAIQVKEQLHELVIFKGKFNTQENLLRQTKAALDEAEMKIAAENKELHITLGTHQSPSASLMPSSSIVLHEALQLNEAESNGLKEEIACLTVDLQSYEGHCKRQSEAIVKLNEKLDSIKVGGGSMCFILLYMNMHSTLMQIHVHE